MMFLACRFFIFTVLISSLSITAVAQPQDRSNPFNDYSEIYELFEKDEIYWHDHPSVGKTFTVETPLFLIQPSERLLFSERVISTERIIIPVSFFTSTWDGTETFVKDHTDILELYPAPSTVTIRNAYLPVESAYENHGVYFLISVNGGPDYPTPAPYLNYLCYPERGYKCKYTGTRCEDYCIGSPQCKTRCDNVVSITRALSSFEDDTSKQTFQINVFDGQENSLSDHLKELSLYVGAFDRISLKDDHIRLQSTKDGIKTLLLFFGSNPDTIESISIIDE